MAGEVRVPVFVSLKDDATQKLQSQLSGLSTSFRNFGGIVGKGITAVAGFSAAVGASRFVGDSVEQAKNLERSLLSVNTVFDTLSPRIESFTKTASEFGLSQSEAAKASVFLGSVLKQSGFTMGQTAAETEKLVKLAADLSTTFGYDVQEALMGMTALFRGEYDPIEKFGVAMKQSEINSELAARGLDGLTGAERRLAEQQIRLELLYQRSTDAQGAFARGAGTLYVETEKMRANFENLQASLGKQLIPVLAQLFAELQPIIEDAGPALQDSFQGIADVIEIVAEIFGELFDSTTPLGEAVFMLGQEFESLFQIMTGFTDKESTTTGLLNFFTILADTLAGILDFLQSIGIAFQVGAKQAEAWLRLDWDTIFNTDWAALAGQMKKEIDNQEKLALATNKTAKAYRDLLRDKNKAVGGALNAGVESEIWNNIGRNVGGGGNNDNGPGGPGKTVESQFKKVQKIIKDYQSKLVKLERDYTRTKFEINRDYENDVARLKNDALEEQDKLLKESRARLTSAFASATKMGLNDLVDSTTRTETIIKQLTSRLTVSVSKEVKSISETAATDLLEGLTKQLAASRQLAKAAEDLAGKGFSQTFIEEILATGSETGNQLASAILASSPEMQAGLKQAFVDLETVSETGLDSLSKQFELATRDLKERSVIIDDELKAKLEERQKKLATSLADAAYAFGISVGDMRDEFTKAIDELDGKLAGLKKTIDELKKKMAGLSGVALSETQAALTGEGGAFEGATVSNINIKKEALNASGIVLDSAADLASTSAYIAARVKAAESFIKSSSSNAMQEASAKAQIESWTKQLAAAQAASASGSAAGTTININVKTDSTQSQAMVGKTLGNVVTKYVTTGGQVLVSGNK